MNFWRKHDAAPGFIPFPPDCEGVWNMRKKLLRYLVLALLAAPAFLNAAEAISIGSTPQLFVDDYLVESMIGLERTFHRPRKHAANPVLTGPEPWENWVTEVHGRPVVFDEQSAEFRMYYGAPNVDETAARGYHYKVGYAVSKDGLHWTKPRLRLVEWQGSLDNNLLPWGENWMRRPNVMIDPHDVDPARRYKMTYVDVIGGRSAITKAYSPDGIHWSLNGDGKPWFRRYHSGNLLGWDPSIRKYVFYVRMPGRPNSVGRSVSSDFVTWSQPETVLAPAPEDRGKDFKGLAAFLYGDLYLGWVWVFDHNQTAEAELVVSRDGIRWKRISPGYNLFPRGEPGAWDSKMVLPNAPVVWSQKIWIYYAGWNIPYTRQALKKTHEGWIEAGQRMQRAGGVATLRLDGFASLDAGARTGSLTTRPFLLAGNKLLVNAVVRGELRVELLDENNEVLPGFEAAACIPVRSDSLQHEIRWGSGTGIGSLRGQPVKLRFILRDGSLYSFRCAAR